jgi:FlaA1/EpsC-like NDP-sugar epimerase
VLADLIGLTAAFVIAYKFPGTAHVDHVGAQGEFAVFLLTLPVWVVVARLHGLYDQDEERTDHCTIDDVVGVLQLVTMGTWITFVGGWVTHLTHPDAQRLVLFWSSAIGLITLGRLGARTLARRQLAYLQNTVIVGAGHVGQLVARKFLQHPEYGINLVGFVDSTPREPRGDLVLDADEGVVIALD